MSPKEQPEKPLRIALLSQVLPPDLNAGGVGTYTAHLARALGRLGQRVHVITRGSGPSRSFPEGVTVHPVPPPAGSVIAAHRRYPVLDRNLAWSLAVRDRVLAIRRSEGLDLVESPSWDFEGFACALDETLPVVARLVSPLVEVIERQGWKADRDLKLASRAEGRLIEAADGIIHSTEGILRTVIEMLGVNVAGRPRRRIPFGIPLAADGPEAGAIRGGGPGDGKDPDEGPDSGDAPSDREGRGPIRILFVGRLEKRKGIQTLLEAMPEVLGRFPDATADIVGDHRIPDGAGAYPSEVFLAAHPGLRKRVRFHGKVDQARLDAFYRTCDLFVAPSLFESFGLIYLEAFRYGKPVIGCRTGGVPEIVEDGVNGLLVPPGDAIELTEALCRLLDDGEMRSRLGRRGFEDLRDRFDTGTMASRSLAFYREVLAGR